MNNSSSSSEKKLVKKIALGSKQPSVKEYISKNKTEILPKQATSNAESRPILDILNNRDMKKTKLNNDDIKQEVNHIPILNIESKPKTFSNESNLIQNNTNIVNTDSLINLTSNIKSKPDSMGSKIEDENKEDKKEIEINDELRRKYLKNYNFLAYDATTKLLFCQLCRSHNFNDNVLAKGKLYIRDTHIDQHILIKDHKQAVMNELMKQNKHNQIESFLNPKLSLKDEELMPLFRNIFWLCVNNIAIWKCDSLHKKL